MQKRTLYRIGLMMVCGIIAVMGVLFYPHTDAYDFWQLTGLKKDQIEDIYISYQGDGERLRLPDRYQKKLLEVIQSSVRDEAEKDENQPLFESDYAIWFEQEGELKTYPLYWFSGRRPLREWDEQNLGMGDMAYASGIYTYIDRRFDIQIKDRRFSFQQAQDIFWNEDISMQAYNDAAKEAGKPQRYELDGYDEEGVAIIDMPTAVAGIYEHKKTAQQLIEESDLVVTAKWTGMTAFSDRRNFFGVDELEVLQVWKGNFPVQELIYCPRGQYGEKTYRDGRKVVVYQPAGIAIFEEGREYVLCLQTATDDPWRIILNRHLFMISGDRMFGVGVLEKGHVYPAYNTEYHPFYGQTKEELLPE